MRKNKSKNKSPLKTILFSLLIIGAIGYYAVSRLPRVWPVPIGINEVSVSSGTVLLSLPPSILLSATSDSSVPLTIDTGSSKVSAVQVELSYDPSAITTPTVTPGTFLSVVLVKPKISQGKITFVLAAPPESGGKDGTGTLATLKFRSLGSSNSALTFTGNTMVASVGSTSNALKSASNATIQIAGLTTTSAPTTAPTQQVRPTTTPVNPSTSTRVFNPTGNFDYSKPAPINSVDTAIGNSTPPSAFTRFLAIIKAFFGIK